MITKNDILCSDKFLALDSPSIAYIKTDVFHNDGVPIHWRGKTHGIRPASVWISGHADNGVTQAIHDRYSKNTNEWFTINKECEHPNIHALPLGITNDCDDSPGHKIIGNLDVMIEVMNMPRDIKNLVYMNISVNTYPRERHAVFNAFINKPWVTVESPVISYEGRRRFLMSIRNHRFVLCPRGNGVDTHRLWETLYMGSIPIVVRHTALNEFQDLPICWIDNWSQVTQEFLETEFKRITDATWNMDKLKFGYWRDRILACAR